MSVAEAPARAMPRAVPGQRVLFNTGNSSFWHPATVTMASQNSSDVELAVLIVTGRDQYDLGGESCHLQMKSPCWYYQDPRIAARDPLWETIIEGQVGGMWKFDENETSYVKEIDELQKHAAWLEKRLAKVDKFLLELGHPDTQGNEPGAEPKQRRRPRTPNADADNESFDSES